MANEPEPWLKELATHVVRRSRTEGTEGDAVRAFCAFEKLRHPLGKMLGAQGFQSLLARAVTLTGATMPWLRSLRANSNGTLDGLLELRPPPDPQTVAEGEALILGELLGLLITFIGPSLTLGLVQETWPDLEIWKA